MENIFEKVNKRIKLFLESEKRKNQVFFEYSKFDNLSKIVKGKVTVRTIIIDYLKIKNKKDQKMNIEKILSKINNQNNINISIKKFYEIINTYNLDTWSENDYFAYFDLFNVIYLDEKIYQEYIYEDRFLSPYLPVNVGKKLREQNKVKASDILNTDKLLFTFIKRNLIIKIKNNLDSEINDYINTNYNKDNILLFVRKTRRQGYNKSIKLTYSDYLNKVTIGKKEMIFYFDSSEGRLLLKRLLSFKDGYIEREELEKNLIKYNTLIKYMVSKELIYNFIYDEFLDIYYFGKKVEIDLTKKVIKLDEYNRLINDIKIAHLNKNRELDNQLIEKSINNIYKLTGDYYVKGYVSLEFKVAMLYKKYFSSGITNKDQFKRKYEKIYNEEIDVEYTLKIFFSIFRKKYIIKKKLKDKYKISEKKDQNYYLIIMLCEIQNKEILVCDIVKESKLNEKEIIGCINESNMYFQLSYNRFIRDDLLIIPKEFFDICKESYTATTLYKEASEKCERFLEYYKIKNKYYLYRIYKKMRKYAIIDKN